MNEGSVNNDLGKEQFEALRLELDQKLQESRAAGLSNEVLFYEGALNALARVEPIVEAVERERGEALDRCKNYREALERTERILCGMTPAFQGRVEMVARIQAALRNSGV